VTVLRWALAFALALGAPLVASAGEFKVPPTPTHYVTDTGSALGETTRATLETTLRKYEKATGNQIVVYIADTTGGVPLEDWTAETADTWKIGHKKSDNGAVLFLFTGDRQVRIEVGYGLESALTDADAKRIIDTQIVPRMKAGDIDDAIGDGVGGMLHQITPSFAISPPSHAPETSDDGGAGDKTLWIAILLIAMVALAIYSNWRNTKGGYWSGSYVGGSFGGGGGGGGFSAGGGGFGGGGASGGW
jgi:uncharacterized protein